MNEKEINQWLAKQDMRDVSLTIEFQTSSLFDKYRSVNDGIYDGRYQIPYWAITALEDKAPYRIFKDERHILLHHLCLLAWQYEDAITDVLPKWEQEERFTEYPAFGNDCAARECYIQLASQEEADRFRENILRQASDLIAAYERSLTS